MIRLWLLGGTAAIMAALLVFTPEPARPHDIYSGVHGRNAQLCCGGDDCAATTYRMEHGRYFFKKRDDAEVEIPEDRITFLPIPGEDYGQPNGGHLCYRTASDADRANHSENIFDDIFLYCAFVTPGSI